MAKKTKAVDFYQPHFPIHLKFENLTASTADGKKIIDGVSGEVRPGEILAIMGPSGAGKSTLLNFLSGRQRNMTLDSGQILINGQTATEELQRGTGYVLQNDVFFSHLTVSQTLQFVGQVRLSDKLKRDEKRKIVNNMMDRLGLRKCADTIMGGDFFNPGCSGGEKKRTAVAAELITNPSLLIMDEPTSGLDAATTRQIIEMAKGLAHDDNRTVIVTIHQPSSQVFYLFDKLLLLCNGKLAYFGKTEGVIKFFDHIGRSCDVTWNPADFILDQLSEGDTSDISTAYQEFIRVPETRKFCFDEPEQSSTTALPHVAKLAILPTRAIYRRSIYNDDDDDTEYLLDDYDSEDNKKESKIRQAYNTSFLTQSIALFQRSFIQIRKEIWDKQSFIQVILVALLTGIMWFNTPYDEQSLVDRKGVIYYILMFSVMLPIFSALMTFPIEKGTIAKERDDGMYRLSAYYVSKSLSELPVIIFQPVLFYTIAYWMAGLNRSVWFLVGVCTVITYSILSQTFGLMIGASISNFKHSMTFCVIFSDAITLVSGYFTSHIPIWLRWIKYLSHLTYAYNIFIRMEFSHAVRKFKCAPVNSAYQVCTNNVTEYLTGADIEAKMVPLSLNIGESFVVLWGFIIFFRVLLYFILKYFNKPY